MLRLYHSERGRRALDLADANRERPHQVFSRLFDLRPMAGRGFHRNAGEAVALIDST